ncbi:MAG: tyrosine-protein phosphatase [Bacteroidota bacterium]
MLRVLPLFTALALAGCAEADRAGLAVAASAPETAALDSVRVERGDDGVLALRWSGADAVDVYAGATPDVDTAGEPVASGTEGELRLPVHSDSTARPFFRVVPVGESANAGRVVAERALPLQGATNFRDLGGYASADGRRVRWGQVYRTGALADLTGRDLDVFSRLGVEMVCDLRRPHEVEAMPDRLPTDDPPRTMTLDISGTADREEDEDEVLRQLRTGEVSVAERMVEGYRDKALVAAPLYTQMFEALLDPENRPFLFHCQGGEDRAGIGAALILLAIDVPRETVMEDYLLTNEHRVELAEEEIVHYARQYEMPVEVMRGFVNEGAVADALAAVFDAIDDAYGSTDAYLRDALGLSDEDRARLKDALLV